MVLRPSGVSHDIFRAFPSVAPIKEALRGRVNGPITNSPRPVPDQRCGRGVEAAVRAVGDRRLSRPRKQDGDGRMAWIGHQHRSLVPRASRRRRRRLMLGEQCAERDEIERHFDRLGGVDAELVYSDLLGPPCRFP